MSVSINQGAARRIGVPIHGGESTSGRSPHASARRFVVRTRQPNIWCLPRTFKHLQRHGRAFNLPNCDTPKPPATRPLHSGKNPGRTRLIGRQAAENPRWAQGHPSIWVNRPTSLSPEMALRLEKALGRWPVYVTPPGTLGVSMALTKTAALPFPFPSPIRIKLHQ
jgi:hypothetical protein